LFIIVLLYYKYGIIELLKTNQLIQGAPWNDTHWSHDKFNKLLVEARAELDSNKRMQLYGEMQEICKDNGGTVVSMFNQIVEAHSNKLDHGAISAHMEMDGHKNVERWWFKS
jgi:peptide/nickel transport system substrate-binding protein